MTNNANTAANTEHSNPTKISRAKLVLFALGLGAMSLFMYVSFIVKTALKGP